MEHRSEMCFCVWADHSVNVVPMVGMGCMNSSCFSLKRMVVFPAPSSPRVTTRISILGPMWTRLSWNENTIQQTWLLHQWQVQSQLNVRTECTLVKVTGMPASSWMWSASSVNWCCCFWSVSSKQLISCFASTTLQSSCSRKETTCSFCVCVDARGPFLSVSVSVSYLLEGFLTVQAGSGDLRQQDCHVLLLLPQPDQPLPDVGVHHAQRHLLLPAQSLVKVCEVSPDTGSCTLCCAGNLMKTQRIIVKGDSTSGIISSLRSSLGQLFL